MTVQYKRGTVFSYLGRARNPITKQPINLTGYTIEAQLRGYVAGKPTNTLIAQLNCTLVNSAQGIYRISYDQTAAKEWALGPACMDIIFINPAGDRIPTLGYQVFQIIEPVTREA